jgi:hypothetical protein
MASETLTRHEAEIFIEETGPDSRGNTVTRPSTTSVRVRCTISPRISAADRAGTDLPRWSFLSPPDVPLGKWSRVVALGRTFAVTSWPRLAGPEGSAVHHIEAELIEQR